MEDNFERRKEYFEGLRDFADLLDNQETDIEEKFQALKFITMSLFDNIATLMNNQDEMVYTISQISDTQTRIVDRLF